MCFSLTASVAGGIVISSIGVATVKKIQSPSRRAFSAIPLVFGIQQFSEGLIWLALTGPEYAHLEMYGTYSFLFIARILWPVLMPFSVLLMEEDPERKKVLRILCGIGCLVALYYSYCLLLMKVSPNIAGHHIQYISDFPESLAVPVFVLYFIAGVPPLFVSSHIKMRLLGTLLFISCLVTGIFFIEYLTSVWCFFAAAASIVVYWILKK